MSWAAAATVAAGYLGYKGQQQANQATAKSVDNQIEFQREMSNTSYQRAMKDMRKAGLNPMLAYKLGGASTPQGAHYVAQNEFGAGINAATQTSQAITSAKQQASQAKLNNAQKSKITAEVETQIPAAVRKLDAEGDLARAGISLKEAETVLKDLNREMLQMDIKALEKLGLSPMQLKHTPFNQLGSLFIDKVVEFCRGTGFDKGVGYMTTPELEQAVDQAMSQESP